MNKILSILLLSAMACLGDVPKDFGAEARASYLRMKRVVQEAQLQYVGELEDAAKAALKAGNFKEAEAIAKEIERVRVEFVGVSTDRFIGRIYERPAQTTWADTVRVKFGEGGVVEISTWWRGKRKGGWKGRWKTSETGVVVLSGDNATDRFWRFAPGADTASVRVGEEGEPLKAEAID